MKKITILFVLIALFSYTKAAVILDETFDYSVSNLATAPGWSATGTLTTGTGRNIVTPALTYSNTGGTYILSGVGKAIHTDVTASTSYLLTRSISTINTGVYYFTYMYKAGVVQTQTAVEVFGMGTGTSAGPRIWVGKTATTGNWKFGITRSSTTTADVSWDTQEFSNVDEVVLLVIKHDFSTGVSSFYINPTLNGTEPAVPAASNNNGTARTSLNNLWFRANGSSMFNYSVGGARLSTTWAEAVQAVSNAPQLSAPEIGTATNVAAESFTANWTPVANAIGYTVKVYQGSTAAVTVNVDGQATASQFVKGLLTATNYSYKVIAKGNGLDFSDSDESAASTSFTTSEGLTYINTVLNDGTWGTLWVEANQPAAGSFPSSYQNGFDLTNTFLYDITRYDLRGERKQYGLRMDRMSNGGMVVLPTVKSLEQIEIHAIPGGAPRSITLKELVGASWVTIGTYEMTSSVDYKEFIIPLSRAVPTKLRIENAGTGQVTLYHIATRTTNPALLTAPVVGSASGISATGFTANWQSVANATGYKVRVYLGTDNVVTVDAAGQSTESVAVTGLEPETTYTYKVYAVGDGFDAYADSYLSDASPSFATSALTSVVAPNAKLNVYATGATIYSNVPGQLEVFNLQGASMLKATIQNELSTGLNSGMYLARLTTADNRVVTTKISIKQ
jgi:hypothetical protein